jgi:poly(3-hydroxybutyrate) depolymerase
VGRSASGGAPTTCSVDGGALQAGGAFNRVEVYNTTGGTRSFFLVLPLGYNAEPRTLLITLHGGIVMGDVQMRGARQPERHAHARNDAMRSMLTRALVRCTARRPSI